MPKLKPRRRLSFGLVGVGAYRETYNDRGSHQSLKFYLSREAVELHNDQFRSWKRIAYRKSAISSKTAEEGHSQVVTVGKKKRLAGDRTP